MAVVNKYSLGAPCWFELATTDQAAAKQFYGRLFGWEANDNPMGPDMVYTLFKRNGQDVGATFTMEPSMREQAVPPHWAIYFATPDVDQTVAKAKQNGGSVILEPFDVMTFGRMAVCKDPGDAHFHLWQSKTHQGAGLFGEEYTVCWAELNTWDTAKGRAFYTALFGWQTKGSAGMATYIEFSVDGRPVGGLLPMDESWKGIPSHWSMYVMVPDCPATVAKAKELRGTVRFGPHTQPGVGVFAGLVDPQGAGFQVITLERPAA